MVQRTQQYEQTTVTNGVPVQTTRRVTQATTRGEEVPVAAAGYAVTSTAERVIYFITGVLLTLLAFRFVLSLLGANRGNGFADFIYSLSYPFVAPFFGLFGYNMQYGVARVEVETLVAMAVYGLLGYGITRMVAIAKHTD